MKKYFFVLLCNLLFAIFTNAETYDSLWSKPHLGEVTDIKFSPDGSKVASCSWDNTIRMWDANTGSQLWIGTSNNDFDVLAFSPDGSRIVCTGYREIKEWNVNDGSLVWEKFYPHYIFFSSVEYSPDGSKILCAVDSAVKSRVVLYDANNGNEIWVKPYNNIARIYSATFNPDGSKIAICPIDSTLKMLDANNGNLIWDINSGCTISTIKFNFDGTKIVGSGNGNVVNLWNSSDGSLIWSGNHNGVWVDGVTFNSDGSKIASCGSDFAVKLWDVSNGQLLWTGYHDDRVASVAFSPDGQKVVSGGEGWNGIDMFGEVKVWNTNDGNLIWTGYHSDWVRVVTFSPDGNKIASGGWDNIVKVWVYNPNEVTEAKPMKFSLKQNYPNPFNPKTKIKYEIAKSGFVNLKIYDVLGREIKTLVNESQNVGYYEVDFDANNLNSGIYFYKLTTNNFSEMKKMILVK